MREKKKIGIVIGSSLIYGFNGYGILYHYDYGYHAVGTMIKFDFRDPDWAVNREELQNKFTGRISRDLIYFSGYDEDNEAAIEIEKEHLPTNIKDGSLVSFSVYFDGNRPYAKDIQQA